MRLIYLKKKKKKRISCQDGGIGRYTLPPCKTKRKTTTNLKTKNNQNWQKMELCGSLTTKELKKKHSSRPVGGVEMGSWAKRTLAKLAAGGPGEMVACGLCGPTFSCRKTWRNNWGARQTVQPRVQAWGMKTSKPLTEKTCGGS